MPMENLTPKKGEIAFLWFNRYSGVVIKTPSKTLVFDPADVESRTFKKVNAVFVTHEHRDHLARARAGLETRIDDVVVRGEGFSHPAATPVSFLVTTEEGIKIYRTGDTLLFAEMKHIGDQSPPDIVFCPVGTPAPGASPETGVEIVKMVKPKAAVPYHAPKEDLTQFQELLSKKAPKVRCIIVKPNVPYKYP